MTDIKPLRRPLSELESNLAGWRAAERERERSRRMLGALRVLARRGCSRLTDPHTCRQPSGYPREEWCEGCIAADGLGLPVEWFVLKP